LDIIEVNDFAPKLNRIYIMRNMYLVGWIQKNELKEK
jgi:hypothetical protein